MELTRCGKYEAKDMVIPPPRENAMIEKPPDSDPVHDSDDEAAAYSIWLPKSLAS